MVDFLMQNWGYYLLLYHFYPEVITELLQVNTILDRAGLKATRMYKFDMSSTLLKFTNWQIYRK